MAQPLPFEMLVNRADSSRFLAIAALSLILAGCKGDAGGDSLRQAAATPVKVPQSSESSGDVVIRPPSAPYRAVEVTTPGSVSGTVTLKGELAPRPAIETGAESQICGPSIADESVQLQGGGLAGAVVWLEGVRTGKPIGLERRVELESTHCKLSPRVQAAVVGSAVNVLAHDEFRQHLRFVAAGDSSPRAAILLGGGEQVIPTERPFTKPGMVAVSDKDHAWPRAFLAVFDHPYFAVTGAGGAFTLDGVPPGKYTLRAWHERTGMSERAIEVAPNGAAKVTLELVGK